MVEKSGTYELPKGGFSVSGAKSWAPKIEHYGGHRFMLDGRGSPHVEGFPVSGELENWSKDDSFASPAEDRFEPPKPNAITDRELHHAADGWKVVEVRYGHISVQKQ